MGKKGIRICLMVVMISLLPSTIVPPSSNEKTDVTSSIGGTSGFLGEYRNFDPDGTNFASGGCSNLAALGRIRGLVESDLPWRPSGLEVRYATPPNWYTKPCCLIRIDSVENCNAWPNYTGLWFTATDFKSIPELNEGKKGDPWLFTVHWEARIYADSEAFINIRMDSNDDSFFFFDGQLELDLGGGGKVSSPVETTLWPNRGYHTIDIYYAERCDSMEGPGEFYFGMNGNFEYADTSQIYAKKSFEDLLRRQAERIESFENLFKDIPPSERTFELFESFEDLTKEQEELLKSFEELIEIEVPSIDGTPDWRKSLLEAEFINLLKSFEDLLHDQYELIESFADLFVESKGYLFDESESDFASLLFSLEDLIRSQDQLLESFEDLLWILFTNDNYDPSLGQKKYFLESFEDLLVDQSELLMKFEDLVKWWG